MDNMSVLETLENERVKIEVMRYDQLTGSDDPELSFKLFYHYRQGARLKQVKLGLKKGQMKIEAGALHFMKGNVKMETPVKKGLLRNVGTGLLGGESVFKPVYSGVGEVWLEPSFKHYLLADLQGEEIIVDKGMFLACEEQMEVSAVAQKNISSAFFGGEDFFQTRISCMGIGGSGITCTHAGDLGLPIKQRDPTGGRQLCSPASG